MQTIIGLYWLCFFSSATMHQFKWLRNTCMWHPESIIVSMSAKCSLC